MWDGLNDKCRDECTSIYAAGYATECTTLLPWCVGRNTTDNSTSCTTDCTLASQSQCGHYSYGFRHCRWNLMTKQCLFDCTDFSKSKCPTDVCEVVNNTRTYTGSPSRPTCTAKCSAYDGNATRCAQMTGHCVYLSASDTCVVSCNLFAYLPNDNRPAYCDMNKTCTGSANCRNLCSPLNSYSCVSDTNGACDWTGTKCDTACSLLSVNESLAAGYCGTARPVQPTLDAAVTAPKRVWPGTDTADLLPSGTVAPAPTTPTTTNGDGGVIIGTPTTTPVTTPTKGDGGSTPVPPSTPAPPANISVDMSLTFNGNSSLYTTLLDGSNSALKAAIDDDISDVVLTRTDASGGMKVTITKMQVGSLIVNFTVESTVTGTVLRATIDKRRLTFNHFARTRTLYNTQAASSTADVIPFNLRTVEYIGLTPSPDGSGSRLRPRC
jgi:hypothetical protein